MRRSRLVDTSRAIADRFIATETVTHSHGSDGEHSHTGTATYIWLDFDMAATRLNEARVERAWLDLIFEGPEMNAITLRDVTMSRRPRAEL